MDCASSDKVVSQDVEIHGGNCRENSYPRVHLVSAESKKKTDYDSLCKIGKSFDKQLALRLVHVTSPLAG